MCHLRQIKERLKIDTLIKEVARFVRSDAIYNFESMYTVFSAIVVFCFRHG